MPYHFNPLAYFRKTQFTNCRQAWEMVVSSFPKTLIDFTTYSLLANLKSWAQVKRVLNFESQIINFLTSDFLTCLFDLVSFIFALISSNLFYRCQNFLCRFWTLLPNFHIHLCPLNLKLFLDRIFERKLFWEALVASCLGSRYYAFAVLLFEIRLSSFGLRS